MADLKGTKTHRNLQEAFSKESQANRRYLYFADKADIEGFPEVAGNFRDTSEGESGHANGHLDFLRPAGDPVSGLPIGSTEENLRSAIASEETEETMYREFARIAHEEGFDEIAEWFETLSRAERSHANRFARLLTALVAAE
jgi:rubrerythrin